MKIIVLLLAAACLLNRVEAAGKLIDLTNFHDKYYQMPVELEVGDRFEIKIRENPSTGYKWMILDSEMEKRGLKDVIVQSEARYKSDDNPRGASGVGGTRYLEFTALKPGKGDLHLLLARSWELETILDMLDELDSYVSKMIPIRVRA